MDAANSRRGRGEEKERDSEIEIDHRGKKMVSSPLLFPRRFWT